MEQSIVELEHVIGLTGNSFLHHPTCENAVVYSIGSVLVVADLSDSHQQSFLRRHTEEISTLAISEHYVASGQFGASNSRHAEAPICVWDFQRRELVFELLGHSQEIIELAFSPDEKYLAAISTDCKLCIWEMENRGLPLGTLQAQAPLKSIAWGPLERTASANRRVQNPSYQIVYCEGTQMKTASIFFDLASQSYILQRPRPCSLPSTGFGRSYNCITVFNGDILGGTDAGELCTYNYKNQIYRKHLPVCGGSAFSIICSLSTSRPRVVVGGGHGTVTLLEGNDQNWEILDTVCLPDKGNVCSLSLNHDHSKFIAITSRGFVYELEMDSLIPKVLAENPQHPVQCLAFSSASSEYFCSGIGNRLSVWDLSEYKTLSSISTSSPVACVAMRGDAIVSGHEDGTIRCSSTQTSQTLWKISGHRGAVLSLHLSPDFLLTGGEDGGVRLWSRRSHELLCQFSEHKKAVTSVMVDFGNDKIGHSVSADHSFATYNFQRERKAGTRLVRDEVLTCIGQRTDPQTEMEIITGSSNGRVSIWDCDFPNPISSWSERRAVNNLSVSPSGRFLALCLDNGDLVVYDLSRVTTPETQNSTIDPPQLLARATGHSAPATSVVWSPDERQIVTGGNDRAIFIWNFYGN